MSVPGLKTSTHREKKMKQLLKTSVAPATAFFALAFVAMATPAAAYEYCRRDITSYMLAAALTLWRNVRQCPPAAAAIVFAIRSWPLPPVAAPMPINRSTCTQKVRCIPRNKAASPLGGMQIS